jgi:hypothetical protein
MVESRGRWNERSLTMYCKVSMARLHQLTRVGTAVAIVPLVILAGCSKTVSFQEEVEIAPGKVIVITQERYYEKACEGFKCGWKNVRFRIDKTAEVPIAWEGPTIPMLLLPRDARGIVLVTREGYCAGPPYQQFVLRADGWVRQELERRFHGQDANLFVGGPIENSTPRTFTLADKQKLRNRPGMREYQRRILPEAPRNC